MHGAVRHIAKPHRAPFVTLSEAPTTTATIAAPPRLLVSLATYDEAKNLEPLVHEIRKHAPHAEILVIDDDSPDGTGAIADRLAETLPGVHVLHRPRKLGPGHGRAGGDEVRDRERLRLLPQPRRRLQPPAPLHPGDPRRAWSEKDVMIGSRYVPGGGVEGEFNLKRKFMSTGINVYARLLLGLRTRDNSGSYRCYRVSKLRQIDLGRVRSRGYSFMEEILYWCRTVGCTMGETPILFENRRAGYSKINKAEAIKALQIIAELGVGRALGRHGKA